MAFIPSESPGINIKEFDLSGVVPAVTTSTGAIVGDFNWGPVSEPVKVANEAQLVSSFGSPTFTNDSSAIDYLSASSFLKYSSDLFVVREVGTGAFNAKDSDGTADILIRNDDDWLTQKDASAVANNTYIAKHAGLAGNSIDVHLCPVGTSPTVFSGWAYAGSFDSRPGTSSHVASLSPDGTAANDEVHIVVVDRDGKFTGTKGTVLETYPFVSIASDAKTPDGTSNFALDVINAKSEYIRAAGLNPGYVTATSGAFTAVTNGTGTKAGVELIALKSGAAGTKIAETEYATGFAQFSDVDTIQVDFLIAPGIPATVAHKTVVENLVAIATARKDCVVVASPPRGVVVNAAASTLVANTVTWSDTLTASSYLIVDNNYLKVYDKYNDQYVFIPASASTAGVMAATDDVSAPWFSPAGSRRGQYLGVTALAHSPTKAERDTLYKAGVNPIVNIPGQGILLFGDKTKLGRPSAFDRINVRRLFLGVERAVKAAAQNVMFEFNDEFTRAEFVNVVEPFLREIKGRRGITDFRVVCDETNNTGSIIDSNQFVATVFIKPARSINYVTLNFVAVRTGVDFDEVVGLV
tara:strand:+ start:23036 stop:24778 length:1743 start_codon:yes stop_codon:yes gene_type:complete